ncbi:MAG TPA: RimK family alpha-L-glutamate ligase [Methylophaga aminisulfidivorans]|uniref:RimK family alpha-L-glutamate ligase n=2 Tax=root TaxID=1 RepID=A0A7C1W813_9GAMM|nr:RimK family alpha-L-glutamate ligase [Methylophaga aminisulfidivorans]HEC74618.1 RimK family alpha-L-glutamate ligase [Methylophaga aminisulfidivorans]
MASPRVVIFNDTHGWHSEQLAASLSQLGVDTILTDLAQCKIDIDSPTGLFIPELGDTLPDAAMVRGIAPGFLEQITLRMDVLHTLSELGVPVFNPASAIEHTVDKARTSLKLKFAGLRTPRTWACEVPEIAKDIVTRELSSGNKLVMKPLFGCQGKGIELIQDLTDFDNKQPIGGAFYLQEYVAPEQEGIWQDWRLLVIDGELCASMSRRSSHWITNFAQGAECFATTVTDEMKDLAIQATKAVSADYAGVDLIRDYDGHFSVLEVNSVPAWKGLFQATGVDVASILAKALVKRTKQHTISHVI